MMCIFNITYSAVSSGIDDFLCFRARFCSAMERRGTSAKIKFAGSVDAASSRVRISSEDDSFDFDARPRLA